MHKLILPLFLLLTNVAPSFAQAAPQSRYSGPRFSTYCTDERFQSYITLAAGMRDYVTPFEYAELYLPLKILAAKAQITLKTYGPLSQATHTALSDIVMYVVQNQTKFDALWEVEAFFPVAQDLMEMTEQLSRDLQ